MTDDQQEFDDNPNAAQAKALAEGLAKLVTREAELDAMLVELDNNAEALKARERQLDRVAEQLNEREMVLSQETVRARLGLAAALPLDAEAEPEPAAAVDPRTIKPFGQSY